MKEAGMEIVNVTEGKATVVLEAADVDAIVNHLPMGVHVDFTELHRMVHDSEPCDMCQGLMSTHEPECPHHPSGGG